MLTLSFFERFVGMVDGCPWPSFAGRSGSFLAESRHSSRGRTTPRAPLYTPEERIRRDRSPWTLVQGVLAPFQFLVFLISLGLVVRYLTSGVGLEAATISVIVKTIVLYTIMVTGAIWEHQVFGKYLFAPAFYWEDVFSMLVIALHTAYVATVALGGFDPQVQMYLALAAYATYVINAGQFILKLRTARLDRASSDVGPAGAQGA